MRRFTLAAVICSNSRAALVVENEFDIGALQLLAGTHPRVFDIFAGHQRARFQDIGNFCRACTGEAFTDLAEEHLAPWRRAALHRIFRIDVVVDQFELQKRGLADNILGPLRDLGCREVGREYC